MPPGQVVFSVKASIAIQKSRSEHPPLELLFDSTAQPLPAGARASSVLGRQLLYRIGSVYVDMKVDTIDRPERVLLVGQMLDSARPGHPLEGIPVSLLERRRSVAQTLSNDHGEFRLEFDAKDELKLLLSLDRRHPVHLLVITKDSSGTAPPEKGRHAKAAVGASSTRHHS